MGLLGSGPFSTLASGLDLGKVYYFRVIASNAAGTVVSPGLGVFVPQFWSGGIVKESDLVAWWKFDETEGTTAADSSGSNHPGTLQNMTNANWVAGKFGNALHFNTSNVSLGSNNASGQWVDAGDWSTGGAFSVSSWVKLTQFNAWQRVIDFGNGADVDNILLAQIGWDDRARWDLKDTAAGNESMDSDWGYWVTGQWIHAVGTVDSSGNNSSTMKLYSNGVLLGTRSGSTPPQVKNRTRQYIGRSNWNDRYLIGYLDDLRLYEAELSAEDVGNIYNAGQGDQFTAPAITSADTATGTVGSAFTYQVTTSGLSGAIYEAINLAPGLSCNISTGLITGTPTAPTPTTAPAMWLLFIPATKSITPVSSAMRADVPKSGSNSTNRMAGRGISTTLSTTRRSRMCLLFLSRYSATMSMAVILANSEGWRWNEPNPIHRAAPLARYWIPGT